MSDQLKRLIDEQNTVWQRMTDIREAATTGNRDMTAEERTNWDQAEARLTQVSDDIERLERFAKLEKIDRSQVVVATGAKEERKDEGAEREQRYGAAFNSYLRRGMSGLDGDAQQLLMQRFESRDQGTQNDSLGGYLVPDEFRNTVTETMKAYGGLLAVCTVITTSTGADLPWPTNDDTGNEGEFLAENTQLGSTDMLFGQRKLLAHTVNSKIVRVAIQLLQDSAFDLNSWLPRKLGERIGRRAARAWAQGTGIDQPEGITTSVATGATGTGTISSGAAYAYNDMVDLEHSVDPAYRPRARYVLADSALKHFRKLKDTQGRPLWVPIPAPGFPSTLNGYEYTVDNSMPVVAANSKSVAFGDFKAGYLVRQVQGVQAIRLTERYADYLQVGFLGFSRLDGKVDDASALRLLVSPAS
ncbi:phage major capsid protein [Nonomuraea rosea]|uniref:Phage major capsid protein n=1 Tax=Nonomuraea rosea TaxID=638574 RepID=A0ABP6WIX1_9ACTN